MRTLLPLLAGLLALAPAAHAEVYAWRDASGTQRLSNIAPSWYSPTEPSRIRTRVLVNGQVVDDTGLPAEARERLRANRAKAEAWNRPGAPVPAPAAAPTADGAAARATAPAR